MFQINSLRTFIGSKNFEVSRSFYQDLGFTEVPLSAGFSLMKTEQLGFYLQDYYVKDWLDNIMLFVEVADVEQCFEALKQLQLEQKYPDVKLLPIKHNDWGSECFLIDPAGVLLHFGEFNK